MKSSRQKLLGGILFLLLLVIFTDYLWTNEIFNPPHLAVEPPEWHGIQIGRTTIHGAISLIGEPDKIVTRGSYQVYQYKYEPELNWAFVELWIESSDPSEQIAAVLRIIPSIRTQRIADETPDLTELVSAYGKPDSVTWSDWDGERYLIWARYGIAARVPTPVSIEATRIDRENAAVAVDILLFEPMGVRKLGRVRWPWPEQATDGGPVGWTSIKPIYLYDDKEPRDPFDWTGIETK